MSTFCPGLDQEILTRTQQTPGDIFINIWSWATVNLVISRFFPINASGVCDVSDHTAPQHINSWSSIPMYWSIGSSMSLTNRYLWFVTSVCMNTHTHIYICTHAQQFGDIAKSWSRTKACISYIIRKTTYHQKRWLYSNGSDGFMICPQELIYVYSVWNSDVGVWELCLTGHGRATYSWW